MKRNFNKSVVIVGLSIFAMQPDAFAHSKTVYGLANAVHFQTKAHGSFYIQLGSFSQKSNAERLERDMRSKTHLPILTHLRNGYYTVRVGPFNSAAEVQAAGKQLVSHSGPSHIEVKQSRSDAQQPVHHHPRRAEPREHVTHVKKSAPNVSSTPQNQQPIKQSASKYHMFVQDMLAKDAWLRQGNWFIAGDVGVQVPTINNPLTVNNGSGFPSPNDLDSFTTGTNAALLLGVDGGYQWQRESRYFPAYALGLRYKHFFNSNVGGQITQYSLPEFTNYNYKWNLSSDILLFTGKLDLVRFGAFSPFVNGGVGVTFNHASGYQETALNDVTPRISPSFGDYTQAAFAGSVGAGLDWQVNPKLILSLGYEYQSLGHIDSGAGTGEWSGSALQSTDYHSNSAILSVNYLFLNQ